MSRSSGNRRGGFSLIELIVVVMILGILGSIAAPKLLGTSQQATDNAIRHTLSVIRTAIDSYTAEHAGELPGFDGNEATFKSHMAPYLRGSDFPSCTVGPAKNNQVRMFAGQSAITIADEATHSWVYKYETGDFYINSDDMSADDATTYVEF
jgi:prepilin-type N-terminal cleavage/methylation domain-containing protein